jgi:hypothetical protein
MDHRYDFAEQLQALNTSVGFHVGNLRKDIGDIKRFNISLDRRMRSRPATDIDGRTRFVRHALLKLCGDGGEEPNEVYRRYFVGKATTDPARTDVPGWASQLSESSTLDFLISGSVPSLLGRLLNAGLDVGAGGWLPKIPYRTDPGPIGGWVSEASAVPVVSLSLATLTPLLRKCSAISVFSRELKKRSTPAIEAVLDTVLRADINQIIDTALTDDQPSDSTRPAGLLNGVTPLAAGAGLANDLRALASELLADGATNIAYLLNPLDVLDIGLLPGSFSFPILDSPFVPVGRLIAVDTSSFVGSLSAIDISTTERSVVHMSDPALPVVDGAGSIAAPLSSLWQTANIGAISTADVGWTVQPGRVAFLDRTAP